MNRKLAFSTLGCPAWDFETAVLNAAKMGYSAIEVRGFGEELRTERLPCFLPENRRRTKELLREAGISVCVVGTSAAFHDPDLWEEALEEGKAALSVANAMKIPFIRVFGDRIPEGAGPSVLERVADGLRELCRFAEETGTAEVLLEVHGDFNTIETLNALFQKLCAVSHFGLIWDVEHSFRAYGTDFLPFYQTIRPYVRHIHLKDCRIVDGEPAVFLPGKGEMNLKHIVRALSRDDFKGYYSFEWEKRWHPEIPEPETAFPHFASLMNSYFEEAKE